HAGGRPSERNRSEAPAETISRRSDSRGVMRVPRRFRRGRVVGRSFGWPAPRSGGSEGPATERSSSASSRPAFGGSAIDEHTSAGPRIYCYKPPMLSLTPPELVELLMTLPPDRTPFIWGPPGIGKSALVREAAVFLDLPCVTLLGTQIAPEDLIGVPRILPVEGGGFATEFCPPKSILRAEPFLFFIDELNSAVPDVQKAFYSLILDRRLGDYLLPAGSRVVGAGNRVEDRALVRPMATALSNRMVHVALTADAEAWLAWGANSGVHALVLAFIRARPDRLFELPPTDATPAYPTPRAWHMLSDAIGC